MNIVIPGFSQFDLYSPSTSIKLYFVIHSGEGGHDTRKGQLSEWVSVSMVSRSYPRSVLYNLYNNNGFVCTEDGFKQQPMCFFLVIIYC